METKQQRLLKRQQRISEDKKNSLTQKIVQEDTSVNINSIMTRFSKTGLLPMVDATKAKYGDFTQAMSFKDALILKRESDEAFMKLPAKIRERFDNNTDKFMAFMSDPDNKDEIVKLGLTKSAPPVPTDVQILEQLTNLNQNLTQTSEK